MSTAVDAPGSRRELAPGVHQLAVRSPTLPPFRTTWVTLIASGGRGVLIDPGFEDPDDVATVLAWAEACGASDVDRILLSHVHRDHVAGVAPLAAALRDAPVHLHPAELARLPEELREAPLRTVPLAGGRLLIVGDATVRAHHTPGHAPGHLAFEVTPAPDASEDPPRSGLIAGDLLTGRGAPWIGLPDGDVDRYLASVERVRALRPAWLATAHGDHPADPDAALADAAAHRRGRLDATVDALRDAPLRLDAVTSAVYGEMPEALRMRLRSATLANLLATMRARRVVHLGEDEDGPYAAAPGA